jgi:hypothetical protein
MFFSPTGFPSRMLKKSASGVLASLIGSTYRSVRLASSLAAALPAERRVFPHRGWAGEKSSFFERPSGVLLLSMTCDARRTPESSGPAVVRRSSFLGHRRVLA